MGKSKIYFIQAENGLIKIGYTYNVRHRLRGLRACSPLKLELLLVLDGDRISEKAFHKRFAKDRKHGEWFFPSVELLSFIDQSINPPDEILSPVERLLRSPPCFGPKGKHITRHSIRLSPKVPNPYKFGALNL